MTYINPFELLEIDSAESKIIKKAKTKKLAEIQLSEEDFIRYGSIEVDKSQLLKVIEELQDTQKKEYHEFILSQPELLAFLKSGNTRFFEHFQDATLYSRRRFQNFITPYYVDAYSQAFQKAYEDGDVYMMYKMQEVPLLVPQKEKTSLFARVETRVRHLYEDLYAYSNHINRDLVFRTGTAKDLPKTAQEIANRALEGWRVEVLNALPRQFEDMRSQLAFVLKNLAFKVYNNFIGHEEQAVEIMAVGLELKGRRSHQQELRRDFRFLSSKLAEKQERQDHMIQLEIRQMVDKLRDLRKQLEHQSVITKTIVADIERIIDFEKVNQLSGRQANLKHELASEISQIGLFIWNKQEDLQLFNAVLNTALKINLDKAHQDSISKLRKRSRKPKAKPKATTASPNFDLIHMALDGMLEKIKIGRKKEQTDLEAAKMMSLLIDLFRPDVCVALMKSEHEQVKLELFKKLLPIIHFGRRRNPIEVLKFLDKIEELVKSDKDFLKKIEEIGDQILDDLRNPTKKKKTKTKRKPIYRDPLEKVSLKQRLLDIWNNFRVFLSEETNGPDRIVQLGIIGGLGGMVLLIVFFIISMLNKTYQLEDDQLASVEPVAFSFESKRKKYDFEERKSEFVGNQLENGAKPFARCFGEASKAYMSYNFAYIYNNTEEDAVVVVYTAADSTKTVNHAYIRAGERFTFVNLPSGDFNFRFYMGKDWNPLKPNFCGLHGAFDTNPHYVKLSKMLSPLTFGGETNHVIALDPKEKIVNPETGRKRKKFPSISASGFFFNKYQFPKLEASD
jgi:uncharacterized protein YecA (UPF0149 family)